MAFAFLARPAPDLVFTRSLVLRALGAIYLIAIASWWSQAMGLVGSEGIAPLDRLMAVARFRSTARWWDLPTLFWINSSNEAIHAVCAGGCAAAAAMMLGVLPLASSILAWICFVSLATTGNVFMGFQWDALLKESGFLAILISPPGWLLSRAPRRAIDHPVIWLFRWLVFRLMFASGVVKLAGGDETWWSLSAMGYHYWTQPIPSVFSWQAHRMPEWWHGIETLTTLGVELVLPFLIFCGRWGRRIACAGLSGLMLLIFATGNFAYFNLLSIALCLSLPGDRDWRRLLRKAAASDSPVTTPRWKQISCWGMAGVIGLIGFNSLIVGILNFSKGSRRAPQVMEELFRAGSRMQITSYYGLFANMTATRPEIVIEGGIDGVNWKEYDFRWKAGDEKRRPAQVAPHQPRLDWQMWFAALNSERTGSVSDVWLVQFIDAIFAGSKPVLGLLAGDPMEGAKPRFLQVKLYRYQFTTPEERASSGRWWKRELSRKLVGPVDAVQWRTAMRQWGIER